MGKFKEKLNISKEINNDQRQIIEKLVMEYEPIFEYDKEKIGWIGSVKHNIIIEDDQKPIAQIRYRETTEKAKFISEEVDKLLKEGKIRESWSPWASPVTLAGRKVENIDFA